VTKRKHPGVAKVSRFEGCQGNQAKRRRKKKRGSRAGARKHESLTSNRGSQVQGSETESNIQEGEGLSGGSEKRVSRRELEKTKRDHKGPVGPERERRGKPYKTGGMTKGTLQGKQREGKLGGKKAPEGHETE